MITWRVADWYWVRDVERLTDTLKPTRAYVGLFDPARDVGRLAKLFPGLVGVQFIADKKRGCLDLTMAFRNLELSFWWGVNIYEAIKLLEWASALDGALKAGKITFFAAIAEWSDVPRPMFIAMLDKLTEEELYALVVDTYAGAKEAARILAEKLKEKASITSDINIDTSGLERMSVLVRVVLSHQKSQSNPSPIDVSFRDELIKAKEILEQPVEDELQTKQNVNNNVLLRRGHSTQRP